MTNTQHTQGPWYVKNAPGNHQAEQPMDIVSGTSLIATVVRQNSLKREGLANAHLIAAAPELLGWLEKAAQMAEQQAKGGDDAPMNGAWIWLAENAYKTVLKAQGVGQ